MIQAQAITPPPATGLARQAGPGAADMPDPILVTRAREAYRRRRERERMFETDLFADPAWDMLLDLFVARAEGRPTCISSACIGANVPTTTALRYLDCLCEAGFVRRVRHPTDARSRLVELTDQAVGLMVGYLGWVLENEERVGQV